MEKCPFCKNQIMYNNIFCSNCHAKKIKILDAHMKNRINSLSFFSSLIILIGMIAIYFYIKSDLFVLLLGFFLFFLTFIYTRRKLFNNELNKANPVWTKSNYY